MYRELVIARVRFIIGLFVLLSIMGAALYQLTQGSEQVITAKLKTYVRYDTAQGLRELAEKYKISNEDLRSNGLQTYGGAYGWR